MSVLMTELPPLEVRSVVERSGNVEAPYCAAFQDHAGQAAALIGDNGAGKSTFVEITC